MLATSSADVDVHDSEIISVSGVWDAKLYHILPESEKYILSPGDKAQITVSATLENARHLNSSEFEVSYSSSDPQVAEVSDNGIVLAKRPGVSTITAEVKANRSNRNGSFVIDVKV